MNDKDFIAEVFELAYGDNAINKGYTRDEVLGKIEEYSTKSWMYDDLADDDNDDESPSMRS